MGKHKTKRVEADLYSHLMHIGARDAVAGKVDASPILTIGWLHFEKPVALEDVKAEVMESLYHGVFRYRAVPRERGSKTYFEEIAEADFDEDYHFTHIPKKFETDADFERFIEEEVLDKGLDMDKPLWRYFVIDETAAGLCAVLGVSDHTLGDGASQVSALLHMCKSGENAVFSGKSSSKSSSKSGGRARAKARALTGFENLYALWQGVSQPVLEQILPSDAPSKLKQPAGTLPRKWRFALTPPGEQMDLALFKEIKDRVPSATVNDVVLALTALSIRRFYESVKDPLMETDKDLRAMYAVNARSKGADYLSDALFGNHIVVATCMYPMHRSRIDTLLHFRDQSRLRKASPDTLVRQVLSKALLYLPRDKVVEIGAEASAGFTAMVSNVLLSTTPLTLFGQTVLDTQFLAMAPFGAYLGVATYGDKVNAAIVVSEDCDADPNEVLPYFAKELVELHREVMSEDPAFFIAQDKPMSPVPFLVAVAAVIAVLAYALL